jgi:hypothetical protein
MSEHEDIRYKVIRRLRGSILRAVDDIRTSQPRVYLKLCPSLEEYQRLVKRGEDVPLIIKNEKIIRGVGRPDIEVFGGKLLVEIKVKPSEFPAGLKQLSNYIRFYPCARYAVITNFEEWRYYRVAEGKLELERLDLELEGIIKTLLLEGIKIPLSTEEVRNLFSPVSLSLKEFYKIFENHRVEDDALFIAYRNILERLYEASESEIKELFIRHTLMQMIVSACLTVASGKRAHPVRACSGEELEIEVVLPYLKWWKILKSHGLETSEDLFIDSLTESIYSRSLLLDWESGDREDVFRELYEFLIEPETRRKIGEYYTPLWMVEYVLSRIENIRDKMVLDPFCGSGTFLVSAFYKKVESGEKPEKAIKNVVGFDINPFAVSVARAELMMAYQNIKRRRKRKRKSEGGREGEGGIATPLVFNVDSASFLFFATRELFSCLRWAHPFTDGHWEMLRKIGDFAFLVQDEGRPLLNTR